jgi:hypothetical protein
MRMGTRSMLVSCLSREISSPSAEELILVVCVFCGLLLLCGVVEVEVAHAGTFSAMR